MTTEAKFHLSRMPGSNRSPCRYSSRPSRRVRLATPEQFGTLPIPSRCTECDKHYRSHAMTAPNAANCKCPACDCGNGRAECPKKSAAQNAPMSAEEVLAGLLEIEERMIRAEAFVTAIELRRVRVAVAAMAEREAALDSTLDRVLTETAKELGCEPDNEAILQAIFDAKEREAALVKEVEALRGLLGDCVEHLEWSTPDGEATYKRARAEARDG